MKSFTTTISIRQKTTQASRCAINYDLQFAIILNVIQLFERCV